MPFREIKIHAIIPRDGDPYSHIVDEAGNYPSDQFHPETHRTIEGTVHAIGRSFGILALSVDQREPNVNGDLLYRTKPAPPETVLPANYEWRTREHSAETRTDSA